MQRMLLSHKKGKFESTELRWTNLEPVTQSEVRKRRRSVAYECMYMGPRKMALVNLLAGREQRHRCRKWTC